MEDVTNGRSGTNRNGERRSGAFRKRDAGNDSSSSRGSSDGSTSTSEANRSASAGDSNRNPQNDANKSRRLDPNSDKQLGTNGGLEDRSAGTSGSAETERERRNRLRRERYARERGTDYKPRTAENLQGSSESDIVEEPRSFPDTNRANSRKNQSGNGSNEVGETLEAFAVTIESSAIVPGQENKPEASKKKSEPKAAPRAKKYKEPPKEQVSLVASSFQDVYEIIDSVVGMGMGLTGREYPAGLFCLDNQKAEKLARSLCQMNNSLPKLAERVNKISAPATFFSVLLSDLAMKGAIIYGLYKQPRINVTSQPAAGNVEPPSLSH